MNSQKSESSSKVDIDRYAALTSRDTQNKIINYSANLAEGNSAWSKTSSNTKPAPNLVRIQVELEQAAKNGMKTDKHPDPRYLKLEPKIISIVPGKRILLKLESPGQHDKVEDQNFTWKRNILKVQNQPDIVVEDFDNKCISKDIFPPRMLNDGEQSIHVFSSIGWHLEPDLINFHWPVNWESHNDEENYLKVNQKYWDIGNSNISQIIESMDASSDDYLNKALIMNNSNFIKAYNAGGNSLILNHFLNNITPVFSINDELADQLRPNVVEIRDSQKSHLELSQNLAPFPCGGEHEIMQSEDFKSPIGPQNH